MSTDNGMQVELDHIFMWTEPGGGETRAQLERLGLEPTYGRRHVGQGTENICYCFDNAFLELLWIAEENETRSEAIARCQFAERAKAGSPFGFAWRGDLTGTKTWDFRPPYLPDHLSIKVAIDSDNAEQPFMFTFPGSQPPSMLPPERKGMLQQAAGFDRLEVTSIILEPDVTSSETLQLLVGAGCIGSLELGLENRVRLKLKRAPEDAREDMEIVLPF